jgi:hypothetical protein
MNVCVTPFDNQGGDGRLRRTSRRRRVAADPHLLPAAAIVARAIHDPVRRAGFGVGGNGSPRTTVTSWPVRPPRGPTRSYCPDAGARFPGFSAMWHLLRKAVRFLAALDVQAFPRNNPRGVSPSSASQLSGTGSLRGSCGGRRTPSPAEATPHTRACSERPHFEPSRQTSFGRGLQNTVLAI